MTSSDTDQTAPQDSSAGADRSSPTETVVVADFTVTDWQQTDEGDRARAHVSKTFTGALEGTSLAELIMVGGETGRGYIAHEVFTGTLDGRPGTIVFQHGGIDDGVAPFSYGYVVPGTGTDELAGMKGKITFAHDEAGARVRLVLTP